jgi:hypothetical protein
MKIAKLAEQIQTAQVLFPVLLAYSMKLMPYVVSEMNC